MSVFEPGGNVMTNGVSLVIATTDAGLLGFSVPQRTRRVSIESFYERRKDSPNCCSFREARLAHGWSQMIVSDRAPRHPSHFPTCHRDGPYPLLIGSAP